MGVGAEAVTSRSGRYNPSALIEKPNGKCSSTCDPTTNFLASLYVRIDPPRLTALGNVTSEKESVSGAPILMPAEKSCPKAAGRNRRKRKMRIHSHYLLPNDVGPPLSSLYAAIHGAAVRGLVWGQIGRAS